MLPCDSDGPHPRRPATLRTLVFAFALAFCLLASAPRAFPQDPSLGFWEISPARESALLARIPADNAARYAALHRYFTDFGCDSGHLTEQPVDAEDQRPNLLCELPGRYPQRIVVAALYPERSRFDGASHAWPEAVMLPILYHALQAQPRHFTFVFAALSGREGEQVFFDSLHQPNAQPPLAFIALDALGLGEPRFLAAPPHSVPHRRRWDARLLAHEALRIAGLRGFSSSLPGSADPPNPAVFPNDLLNDAQGIPRILLYSDAAHPAAPESFRREGEFISFYLCDLDLQLDPMSAMLQ